MPGPATCTLCCAELHIPAVGCLGTHGHRAMSPTAGCDTGVSLPTPVCKSSRERLMELHHVQLFAGSFCPFHLRRTKPLLQKGEEREKRRLTARVTQGLKVLWGLSMRKLLCRSSGGFQPRLQGHHPPSSHLQGISLAFCQPRQAGEHITRHTLGTLYRAEFKAVSTSLR